MSQPDSARQADRSEDEQFVKLLVAEQLKLMNYITALLGDPDAANGVLQETNLVLWRKADEFSPGSCFSAWAQKVAYWQVRAYIRDRARDRHFFSKELVDQLASHRAHERGESDTQIALRHCLKNAGKENVDILRRRYEEDCTIAEVAQQLGKSVSAIKVRLMRVRQALQKCITEKLAEAPH